jgi:Pyruvate/2-oxoacid:ferredoxin oxidoreductase delta subunit
LIEASAPPILEFTIGAAPASGGQKKRYSFEQVGSDPPQYLSVTIITENGLKQAVVELSDHKTYFQINYSSIDRDPRGQILAGTLYGLETVFGDQSYEVMWPIEGLPPSNLVTFLPTSWYELKDDMCVPASEITSLVRGLAQPQFKGFTTNQWCQHLPYITNCEGDNICGDCMGYCPDPNHICYQDLTQNQFKCGHAAHEPDIVTAAVTLAEPPTPPMTTGDLATVIAVLIVLLIIGLLAWGLSTNSK